MDDKPLWRVGFCAVVARTSVERSSGFSQSVEGPANHACTRPAKRSASTLLWRTRGGFVDHGLQTVARFAVRKATQSTQV